MQVTLGMYSETRQFLNTQDELIVVSVKYKSR